MILKMKYMLPALALGLAALQGCSDDDDNLNAKDVPESVRSEFAKKYPSATAREWEKRGGYYVADFYNNGSEAEAWFTPDGAWAATETDYHNALPAAVTEHIAATYPNAIIEYDDIELVETPSDKYYRIELERGPAKYVYVREDGTEAKPQPPVTLM